MKTIKQSTLEKFLKEVEKEDRNSPIRMIIIVRKESRTGLSEKCQMSVFYKNGSYTDFEGTLKGYGLDRVQCYLLNPIFKMEEKNYNNYTLFIKTYEN